MQKILFVGLGGFIGSVGRYLLSGVVQRTMSHSMIPVGTLAVNVIGAFTIGLLTAWLAGRELLPPVASLFLFAGLLGGFTTFSTFSLESYNLFRDGALPHMLTHLGLHVGVGLIAVWAGWRTADLLSLT